MRPEQPNSDPGEGAGGQVRAPEGLTGKFRFNLVATSEAYESKASAINGIESVKHYARTLRSTTRPTSSQAAVPLDAGIGLAVPSRPMRSLVAVP